jgi:DNA-binding NarL/FixJ family response regulator
MNRLKVLLVDDNREFLQTAAGFLSRHPAMEIVGQADSGKEALLLVKKVLPELVIMDLSMPEMTGLEATRRIKAMPFPPRVIILTLHESHEASSFAQAAGADDFVTKSEFGDSLVPLIFRLFPHLEDEEIRQWA